jgi:hypothetical protein
MPATVPSGSVRSSVLAKPLEKLSGFSGSEGSAWERVRVRESTVAWTEEEAFS